MYFYKLHEIKIYNFTTKLRTFAGGNYVWYVYVILTRAQPTTRSYISTPASARANDAHVIPAAKAETKHFISPYIQESITL